MANRTRTHRNEFHLNDDEQYILDEKFRLSRMKSKSAFLRKLVLYGFVYDVDYSHIREMNALLGNIGNNLNQIAKRVNSTNTIYKKDMEEIKELMNRFMSPLLPARRKLQLWISNTHWTIQTSNTLIRLSLSRIFLNHLISFVVP